MHADWLAGDVGTFGWRWLNFVNSVHVICVPLSHVEMMLMALGYTNSEISKALVAVGSSRALSKSDDTEAWIREAIAYLSR